MSFPYVTFPGTAGNYVSTADVNLLGADTAHGHQSVGNWTAGAGASALVVASASAPATMLFGDQAFKATTDGSGAVIASLTTPSLAGAQHTVSIDIYTSTAGREAFITLDGTNGTVTALTAGTLTRLSATKTVTAGTKTVSVTYRQTDDSDPAASEVVWMARACLRTGTSAVFVPSLRIVGDLDIEWKVAYASFPTDAYSFGLGGVTAPRVYSNASTTRRLDVNIGNVDVSYPSSTTWFVADEMHVYRATRKTDGSYVYYRDNVVDKSGSHTAGALTPQGGVAAVGGRGDGSFLIPGDFSYLEVRDGIDGPVGRRFDAADVAGHLT